LYSHKDKKGVEYCHQFTLFYSWFWMSSDRRLALFPQAIRMQDTIPQLVLFKIDAARSDPSVDELECIIQGSNQHT
jgi:hypothetical protein